MVDLESLHAEGKSMVGDKAFYTIKAKNPKSQSGSPEIEVPVKVLAYKVAFSRLLVQIEPVGGSGHWWVDVASNAFRVA